MTRHLLVVGAQRGGTTYLHALLDAHPDITMARPARPEPKVFLSDEMSGRGLDWYRSTYFAHARSESLLGDKSTSYLEHPDAAVRAMEMLGTPEIVVMLRDPVARAVSNWRFSTEHGLEHRPLGRALADNLEGPRAWDPEQSSVSPFAYLERGRYVDYLGSWLDCFPTSCHVHFFEHVTMDDAAVAGVYEGLGVDGGFRPQTAGCPVNSSAGAAPELDASLLAELRDHFADSDRRLRRMLGHALPWSDHGVDVPTSETGQP